MPDNITQTTDNPYLLNRQHTVNNVYKELLVFRSVQDPNNYAAGTTPGKSVNLYWVKTIKDYPYVEISHGKPNLEENAVLQAPTVNQPNYQSKIAATIPNLQFGDTIKVPNLKIADTGHIVGAEVQSLTLPYIKTTSPITITGAQTHSPIIGHKEYAWNGATIVQSLATTTTINAKFGQPISINLPNFDEWGHYYSNTSQEIKIPNITAPTTGPISITPAYGETKTITHKTAAQVTPTFLTATTTASNPYIRELGQQANLIVAGTDGFGHSIEAVNLPFQINHPTDYTATKIFDYLAPIADISNNTKGTQTRAPLELRLAYKEGQSYMTITPGTTTPIDLMLFNHSYDTVTENAYLKFKFTIEEAKEARMANGSSWEFVPTAAASYNSDSQSGQLITIPSIGNGIKIGQFSITVSDQFEKATLLISGQPKLNTTELTIISAGTSYTNPNSGIEIWDADKVLCLPKLYINNEGHVDVQGNTYIALGDIGNSGNSGNDNTDGNNDGSIDTTYQTFVQIQVIPTMSDTVAGRITELDPTKLNFGLTFQVAGQPTATGKVFTANLPVMASGYTTEQGVGKDVSNIIYTLKEVSNEPAYTIDETNYYWSTDTLNIGNEWNLAINQSNIIPVKLSLVTEQPTMDLSNLIPISLSMDLQGVHSSVINKFCFRLFEQNGTVITPRDSRGVPLNDDNIVWLHEPNSNPLPTNVGIQIEDFYIDANMLRAAQISPSLPSCTFTIKPMLATSNGEEIQVIQNYSCRFEPLSKIVLINKTNDGWPNVSAHFTAIGTSGSSKPTDKTTTDTNNSTTNIDTTQVEDRLSTLEQSMLQLTNISDLKSVNNMESRLKLLEGQLAPVDYDTETEQMAAKNRLEEIEIKVEETKAATEYANVDDKSISIEKSYKTLLLYYTGLVDFIADYLYKQNTTSPENVEAFRTTYQLPLLKGESLIPTGTIPSFSPPVNDGGN